MKKQIMPPENWQDFESLCKKLFGEVWGIPHGIKKNGRLGQDQSGVDVYGIAKGQKKFWGVQCKGKDNYTASKLTKVEVNVEITKANNFLPKLEKFIFATTAVKDASIESYVNSKCIESIDKGGFEIMLYCWEDLVDLIDSDRETYNWYFHNQKFRENFDVQINLKKPKILRPKLYRSKHIKKLLPPVSPHLAKLQGHFIKSRYNPFDRIDFKHPFGAKREYDKGWCNINLRIINSGSQVLEDWKLELKFDNNIRDIDDTSLVKRYSPHEIPNISLRDSNANFKSKTIIYNSNKQALIQKNYIDITVACLPHYGCDKISISWHFLARDFDKIGEFNLKVLPEYVDKEKTTIVESQEECGEIIKIEDFISDNEEE